MMAGPIHGAALGRPGGSKLHSEACERNSGPILRALRDTLPDTGLVLEIACGTGQHAAYFAPRLPHLTWLPTDADEAMLASAQAWRADVEAANLRKPMKLDVLDEPWPLDAGTSLSAIVASNLIHIAPWPVCQALLRQAQHWLPEGGVLFLYGPFHRGGRPTAPSNVAFDMFLRSENPQWGLRNLETVLSLAGELGLSFMRTIDMPANNLAVVMERDSSAAG